MLSIARLVSAVDIASATTGSADATHSPSVPVRPLPGPSVDLRPLRPRPDLLRRRLLTDLAPSLHARGRPPLPTEPPRTFCARRTHAPLPLPPEGSDASGFRWGRPRWSTAVELDDAGHDFRRDAARRTCGAALLLLPPCMFVLRAHWPLAPSGASSSSHRKPP